MSIDNEEKRFKDTVMEYSNVKKMRSNQTKRLRSNQRGRSWCPRYQGEKYFKKEEVDPLCQIVPTAKVRCGLINDH